jgi:hypothetical protein
MKKLGGKTVQADVNTADSKVSVVASKTEITVKSETVKPLIVADVQVNNSPNAVKDTTEITSEQQTEQQEPGDSVQAKKEPGVVEDTF